MAELSCKPQLCWISNQLGYFQLIVYIFFSNTAGNFFFNLIFFKIQLGFPGGTSSEEPTCQCRDAGLTPGLGRSPGGGHGNPLQNSCLENPMDREAWWATVHRVAKSWTQLKQLITGTWRRYNYVCSILCIAVLFRLNRTFCQIIFILLFSQ